MCISCVCMLSCSVVPHSLQRHGLQPIRFLCPWRFSRQEYRSGLLYPTPRELPNPRIEPWSLALQAYSLPSEPPGKPILWKELRILLNYLYSPLEYYIRFRRTLSFCKGKKRICKGQNMSTRHCFHTDLVFCTLELTKNITDTSFSD